MGHTQVSACAAAIITIPHKKLEIAALQVTLQKAERILAAAVNLSQTSHFNELVPTSHTPASELLCLFFMYP